MREDTIERAGHISMIFNSADFALGYFRTHNCPSKVGSSLQQIRTQVTQMLFSVSWTHRVAAQASESDLATVHAQDDNSSEMHKIGSRRGIAKLSMRGTLSKFCFLPKFKLQALSHNDGLQFVAGLQTRNTNAARVATELAECGCP